MITLETKIPDEYIQIVLDMLEEFSDKEIQIRVSDDGHKMGATNFVFDGKRQGESNVRLAQRFIREYMFNCLVIINKNKMLVERNVAINAIQIATEPLDSGTIL